MIAHEEPLLRDNNNVFNLFAGFKDRVILEFTKRFGSLISSNKPQTRLRKPASSFREMVRYDCETSICLEIALIHKMFFISFSSLSKTMISFISDKVEQSFSAGFSSFIAVQFYCLLSYESCLMIKSLLKRYHS